MRATRAVIRLDKFTGNLRAVQERIGGAAICVPVKADAYGHGAVRMGRAALEAGARCLGAAAVEEGAELRAAGITAPVLLFSQPLFEEADDIAALELSPFVSDQDFARALSRAALAAGKTLAVHLKIDTGMGRLGCRTAEAAELASTVAALPGLRIGGTATHLARADSPAEEDRRAVEGQLARFREALEAIRGAGLDPALVHAANSGGVLFHPGSVFDMVRPGILLYGYTPGGTPAGALPVEPVMELRTQVAFIKKIRRGEPLSYGSIWTAREDTWVGTLSAGYADGLPRPLSGGDYPVFIRGRPYPLVGRICMDQCMVNLGPDPEVRRWDEAVIFGAPPALNAEELGMRIGAIPYEILCGVSSRVKRIYVEG